MCRIKQGAILGAKGSSAGAVETGMPRVLKVALACCRTVRGHALAATPAQHSGGAGYAQRRPPAAVRAAAAPENAWRQCNCTPR